VVSQTSRATVTRRAHVADWNSYLIGGGIAKRNLTFVAHSSVDEWDNITPYGRRQAVGEKNLKSRKPIEMKVTVSAAGAAATGQLPARGRAMSAIALGVLAKRHGWRAHEI
jgi:hypothetical protein